MIEWEFSLYVSCSNWEYLRLGLRITDYLSTHQINESHSFLECTVDVTNVNTKEGSGRKRVDEKLNN